jgi:ankyrin repeat protein
MDAASEGNVEVVRLLLERGARPGDKDVQGKTAMQFADNEARGEIVRLLSQAGSK